MRAGMAIRVGKHRRAMLEHRARILTPSGAIPAAPLKGRALLKARVVESPRRSYGYDCGFRLAGFQNRSGHMGSNHRSLVLDNHIMAFDLERFYRVLSFFALQRTCVLARSR